MLWICIASYFIAPPVSIWSGRSRSVPTPPRQPLPSSEVYVLGHRYTQASNAFYCHPTDLPQFNLIINVKIRRTRRSGKMRLRTQQASVHFPSLKVTIFLSFFLIYFFKHASFLLRIWKIGWNTQVITNSKVAIVLILRLGKLNKQHFVWRELAKRLKLASHAHHRHT